MYFVHLFAYFVSVTDPDKWIRYGTYINGFLALGTLITAIYAVKQAHASQHSVEIYKARERATLKLYISPLNLFIREDPIQGLTPSVVSYNIKLYGQSDAFIIDSGVTVIVHTARHAESDFFMFLRDAIHWEVIQQSSAAFTGYAPVWDEKLTPEKVEIIREDIRLISEGKLFVIFSAYVKYRDIFKDVHQINVKKFWRIPSDGLSGRWCECGSNEDNSET